MADRRLARSSPRSRTRSFFATWIVLRFSRRQPFAASIEIFPLPCSKRKRVIDFAKLPSINRRLSYYGDTWILVSSSIRVNSIANAFPEGKFGTKRRFERGPFIDHPCTFLSVIRCRSFEAIAIFLSTRDKLWRQTADRQLISLSFSFSRSSLARKNAALQFDTLGRSIDCDE